MVGTLKAYRVVTRVYKLKGGGHGFYRIIFSSLILFLGLSSVWMTVCMQTVRTLDTGRRLLRLRFDKKKDSEKPNTARTTCKACIYPAVCNIQFI